MSAGSPDLSSDSFAFSHSDHAIESVVLADGRSVRDFLSENPPPGEIAVLVGEGIRREGLRCLTGGHEVEEGRLLSEEVIQCDTMESLLRVCPQLYTRNTFLYRRLNKFLRDGPQSDHETGRNLGLYIGLLRECFCVPGGLNPLSWEYPGVLYRGADFDVDIVADYGRRTDELIRWQGFTSSSGEQGVALGFPGNVLFELFVQKSVASLSAVSAFTQEREFILSPYQWFSLDGIRWDSDCGRWIVSIQEQKNSPVPQSWLVGVGPSSG
jgi:hypothetical protein